MTSRPLFIIACSKDKSATPRPAADLCQGQLTQLCLRAARTQAEDCGSRILSAKHGDVELDVEVAPYEMCLNDDSAVTADVVRAQTTGLLTRTATVLAPKADAGMQRYRLAALIRASQQAK